MEDQQASAFPRTVSVVVTVRSAAARRARMITPELKAVFGPLADSLPRAVAVVVSGLLALALADIAGGCFVAADRCRSWWHGFSQLAA